MITSNSQLNKMRRTVEDYEENASPTIGGFLVTLAGIVLLVVALTVAFALAANAGEARSNSNSRAEANSASSSYAGGGSVTYNYAEGAASATYAGAYDVRTVPSVSAPGIITANTCALGTSGGASGLGWGASFGGTHLDKECNLRAEAGAIQAVAGNKAAIVHLARDPQMCQTFRASGVLKSGTVCPGEKVKVSASTKAAAVSTAGYSKCELNGGKIIMRYTTAGRNNKAAARAACKRSLGF